MLERLRPASALTASASLGVSVGVRISSVRASVPLPTCCAAPTSAPSRPRAPAVRRPRSATSSSVPTLGRHAELVAALELDAEVEAAEREADDRDQHAGRRRRRTRSCACRRCRCRPRRGRGGSARPLLAMSGLLRARVARLRRTRRRRLAACCSTRPRPLTRGERNALVSANIVMIGCRNRNTTTRSSTVARPSAKAKPFTAPTRDDVEHHRGQDRDRVGGDDRPPGPDPGPRHRAARAAALADLVLESFEVDDERVGRDTERDDEAGDAGQGQGEADLPAEEHQRAEGQQRRTGPGSGR